MLGGVHSQFANVLLTERAISTAGRAYKRSTKQNAGAVVEDPAFQYIMGGEGHRLAAARGPQQW